MDDNAVGKGVAAVDADHVGVRDGEEGVERELRQPPWLRKVIAKRLGILPKRPRLH